MEVGVATDVKLDDDVDSGHAIVEVNALNFRLSDLSLGQASQRLTRASFRRVLVNNRGTAILGTP